MFQSLFRRGSGSDSVYAAYTAIVAQSRQPVFYAEWGVPDTVTGRFDMISLHMAMLFRRLRGGSEQQRNFSQAVFDLFFKDMDRSLREMGVTDMGVPKKIQKMGNIFFGLLAALNEALDAGEEAALVDVLRRNIYDEDDDADGQKAILLAQYLARQDQLLAQQDTKSIVAGTMQFESV
ncbi:ubiquinol-cytochrome c chaperone [Devosia pacifica]|uniref:Ubiquinol-cytochrome c chaperone n=1 Tax=Devosia pacifica TaxID=1335967 RepID=A0A918SFH3_9HYPH|nr:ubiquinol-cytochrome C chaperone family protein [Devosia pacifica]GHA36489.1 ubiquinol-cytochrome c chaperone [Devosia pacifica]